ncbi:hypothetical protein RA272_31265, partial [Pseudomonas syringae pv. tagetis]
QMQILMKHRHTRRNAHGRGLELVHVLSDLQGATVGLIRAAEDLQQRGFTCTFLANQGLKTALASFEDDFLKRLYDG